MGVPLYRWMVYNGKPNTKMNDLGFRKPPNGYLGKSQTKSIYDG